MTPARQWTGRAPARLGCVVATFVFEKPALQAREPGALLFALRTLFR